MNDIKKYTAKEATPEQQKPLIPICSSSLLALAFFKTQRHKGFIREFCSTEIISKLKIVFNFDIISVLQNSLIKPLCLCVLKKAKAKREELHIGIKGFCCSGVTSFVGIIFFIFLFCFISNPCHAADTKVQTLYNSLDPKSVSEHLAFYQLYQDHEAGKQALNAALDLLSKETTTLSSKIDDLHLDPAVIDTFVNLVNKQDNQETSTLTSKESEIIRHLARHLPNRKLKGYSASSEAEVLKLPKEEIDLARGLFLSQFGNDETAMQKLYSYEAMIDLMALQIIARLPQNANAETKIAYMNQLIFEEMGFRFPPHSLYAKDIDVYTFLPSVLDGRRGVCLGVSILYICLAQRLDLSLEMVTPPGHIYVRHRNENKIINIETTARGIHLDCDEYLSIDTRSLELRSIKEVIGLAHYNLASTFWHREEHEKTVETYLKARVYLEDDMQLSELLGFAYLLAGNKEEGEKLLEKIKNHLPEHAVSKDTMAEEYLNGIVSIDGIRAIFKPVDEDRASIIEKRNALQKVLKDYPKFTSGIFSLAVTWLQLNRYGEALETLENYHALDPNNPTVEYYLSILYKERYDYNKAWEHFHVAEELVNSRSHNPKILKETKKELADKSPE